MKTLITITAVLEFSTGVAIAVAPSVAAGLLLGTAIDSAVGLVLARMLAAALSAVGAACWLTRRATPFGLLVGMLWYNAAVAVVLAQAGAGLGLAGVLLWPAVALHSALAVWCAASARAAKRGGGGSTG